jgi:hypothetical protein
MLLLIVKILFANYICFPVKTHFYVAYSLIYKTVQRYELWAYVELVIR